VCGVKMYVSGKEKRYWPEGEGKRGGLPLQGGSTGGKKGLRFLAMRGGRARGTGYRERQPPETRLSRRSGKSKPNREG